MPFRSVPIPRSAVQVYFGWYRFSTGRGRSRSLAQRKEKDEPVVFAVLKICFQLFHSTSVGTLDHEAITVATPNSTHIGQSAATTAKSIGRCGGRHVHFERFGKYQQSRPGAGQWLVDHQRHRRNRRSRVYQRHQSCGASDR